MNDYRKIYEEQVKPKQIKENSVTAYMRNIEFLEEWHNHFRAFN